jgi:hypothetical protein
MDETLRRTVREYYAQPEYIRAAVAHASRTRPRRVAVLPNGCGPTA